MSSLTLKFRDPAEEVIVRKYLVEAYAAVLAKVEEMRAESNDVEELLSLATISDYAHERHAKLYRAWRKRSAQVLPSVEVAS